MWKKLSFQYKLFFCFSLVLFILLAGMGAAFYLYNADILRGNLLDTDRRTAQVTATRLDLLLRDMDNLTKAVHSSTVVQENYEAIPQMATDYFEVNPRDYQDVKNALLAAAAGTAFDGCLSVVSIHYDTVFVSNHLRTRSPSKSETREISWINAGFETQGYVLHFLPTASPWISEPVPMLTLVRPLRSSFSIYGVISYSYPVSAVETLLGIGDLAGCDLLLVNGEGGVLYSTLSGDADYTPLLSGGAPAPGESMTYGTDTHMVTRVGLEEADWSLLLLNPQSAWRQPLDVLLHMVLVVFALVLLVMLTFLYLVSKFLAKPVRQLRDTLLAQSLQGDVRLQVGRTNNEIATLGQAIEEIILKVRQQNARLILGREAELQAEMKALEAQMNPHFLYNTLSVIGACGQAEGSASVPPMCLALSKLLRYSVGHESRTITLRDEVANTRDYLYIMQIRHEGKVSVEWDLAEDALSTEVPKLILQPLVENCFQHGFENLPPPWNIAVRICCEADRWLVRVENNGRPVQAGEIAGIRERLAKARCSLEGATGPVAAENGGIGLYSTALRLYIYYRGNEHFSIGTEGDKTVVEIGGTCSGPED